jgi:hypothetical protein
MEIHMYRHIDWVPDETVASNRLTEEHRGGKTSSQQPRHQAQPKAPSSSARSVAAEESNVVKTLHFVLDTLFAGWPDVYRAIRDQLNENEERVYGRRLRPVG